MSSMLISEEDFERMRIAMDKDGDGTVDKGEFKEGYKLIWSGLDKDFDESFEFVWSKIDVDGDGNLTVNELAKFYGFDAEGGTGEMTDDQILQALQLSAELDARRARSAAPTPAAEAPPTKKKPGRDMTIKTIQIDQKIMLGDKTIPGEAAKGTQLTAQSIGDMISLMELLGGARVSDLKSDKEGEESVMRYLEDPGVLVRMEDTQGEMPLHKLARVVIPDGQQSKVEVFKLVFHSLIKKTREEAREAKRTLRHDVNKQDSKGKTPMFQAIDKKNVLMINLLNELDRDRPDSLIVTSNGWSVLHQAISTDDINVVQEVVRGLQKDGGRLRVLINLKDKDGREPLHVAAYRCDDQDIIAFLMDNGAKGNRKDKSGLDPAVLAGKAGKRKSKELIEMRVVQGGSEGGGGGSLPRVSGEIATLMKQEEGGK